MFPQKHLIFGIIFSTILLFLFPQIGFLGFFLIILSTFFIDTDHYLFYVYKKKDLNLKNAYKWFVKGFKKRIVLSKKEKTKYKYEVLIFHGVEFWIVLAFLALIHNLFLYLFIGVMFHIFLDLLALIYHKMPLYIKISQIYLWIKDRNKKELI